MPIATLFSMMTRLQIKDLGYRMMRITMLTFAYSPSVFQDYCRKYLCNLRQK